MKFTRFYSFLILFLPAFVQAVEIEWTTTIPHGELVFLETMSGNAHRPVGMKEYFESNRNYQNSKAKKITASFRDLTKTGWSGVFVEPEADDVDYYDQFFISCMRSKTLDELEKTVSPLIRPTAKKHLFKILRDFYPIYEKFVVTPQFKKFETRTEMLKQLHQKETVEIFQKIQHFFSNDISHNEKLLVGFYPIVQDRGTVEAEIFGPVISIGVPVDEKNDNERLGVIIHEFTHYFFRQMPAPLVTKMNETFGQNHTIQSVNAFQYFNEGLATAIGNGWALDNMIGINSDAQWYDNKIIENYARALYPEVKKYLNNRMTIDENFFKNAISMFDSKSLDTQSLAGLFLQTIVFSNTKVFPNKTIKPILTSLLSVTEMTLSNPIDNKDFASVVKDSPKATRLFIFTAGEKQDVKNLFAKVDVLKPFIPEVDRLKKSSHFSARCNDQVPLVLISAENVKDLEYQLAQINSAKHY